MTKQRKTRADSAPALVATFQKAAVKYNPPDHLRAGDLSYWNATIACRDDWTPMELILVAHLARDLADAGEWQSDLDKQGPLLAGKVHPLVGIIDMTMRRALAVARTLQIHARATRGESRDVARSGLAPDLDDMSELIARPPKAH